MEGGLGLGITSNKHHIRTTGVGMYINGGKRKKKKERREESLPMGSDVTLRVVQGLGPFRRRREGKAEKRVL